MDYSLAVGQRIINYEGKRGILSKVDSTGNVSLEFEDGVGSGGYLYDPFLNEDVRFVNPEWQNKVDELLEEIHRKVIDLINKNTIKDGDIEKYTITKDNADGTRETVYKLKGTEQEAYRVFVYVIKEQQKQLRNGATKWRVIRLFDSESKKQIAQES